MIYFSCFILTIILFCLAFWLKQCPPKKINSINGFRTRRSMQSQEAWDYAQSISARNLFSALPLSLLISAAGAGLLLFGITASTALVIVGINTLQVMLLLWVFYRTEQALKVFLKEDRN